MKTQSKRLISLLLLLTISQSLSAQSASEVGNQLIPLVIILVVVFFLIIMGLPSLLMYKAKGGKSSKMRFSSSKGFIPASLPAYAKGKKVIKLNRGYDINLAGAAEENLLDRSVELYGLQPQNYLGMSPIPKVDVQPGDRVQAGDVIFYDKKKPHVKYVSPVSGEVKEIKRGAKRSISEITISSDKVISYKSLPSFDIQTSSREELVDYLCENGAWSLFVQRPYDIIPDVQDVPRDIFISTFNTAPLAANLNIAVKGYGKAFQSGLDVLKKLTVGKVHLGLNANDKNEPAKEFTNVNGVEKHWFHGQHPVGNVGVQIHHISPIKTGGDKVWTIGVQDVITLGKMFVENKWVADRVIAVCGPSVHKTGYVRTKIGANIEEIVGHTDEGVRFISGDVLSGQAKEKTSFINWRDQQLTVIAEGDYYEAFGWLFPSKIAPSVNHSYANYLLPNKKYDANTNTHGEKRAFVMTGEYEKVLPMDIYPQHLMKAILVNDYEQMEGLGLLELSEEDVALCEFVCTSKMPLQTILRRGLDMMHEQS